MASQQGDGEKCTQTDNRVSGEGMMSRDRVRSRVRVNDVAIFDLELHLPVQLAQSVLPRSHSLMPVTSRNLVSPGVAVSIILKQDQRSGRRTQGIVADVLTQRDHPRGVKVRLRDGQIGRVHDLTKSVSTQSQSHPPQTQRQQQPYTLATMSQNQNPWQDQESVNQEHSSRHQPILDQNNPWQQAPSTNQTQDQNATQNYYQSPPNPPPSHQHQQQQHSSNSQPSFQPHPPPRSQTQSEPFLPQGEERSEQLETLQNYEARAPMSEDDKNQAALQKEFPGVDSSLIAALYGDNKDVAEVREMLQELAQS